MSESEEPVLILPKIKKIQMTGNKIFMRNTMTFIFKKWQKDIDKHHWQKKKGRYATVY